MRTLFAVLVVVTIAYVAASGSRRVVAVDGELGERAGWKKAGDTPPATVVDLLVALKNRNVDKLESELFAVSTPSSAKYGHHLTFAQVKELTAPAEADVATVVSFLKEFGASNVRVLPTGDFIEAFMPVAAVSKMLECGPFSTFLHPRTTQILHRATQRYTLPAHIADLVDFVGGVNRLPAVGFENMMPAAADVQQPATGNAPLVLVANGGSTQKVFTAPLCKAGAIPTVVNPCNVASQTVTYTPEHGSAVTSKNTTCGSCKDFEGSAILDNFIQQACTTRDSSLGFSSLYCLTYVDDVVLGVPNTVQATTVYADGEESAAGSSSLTTLPYATPDTLKAMYGVPSGVIAKPGGLTEAVAEFLGQYYSPADLKQFLTTFGLPVPASIPVNGPNDVTQPGGEANLDIQVMTAMAEMVPTQFWSTGGLRNNSEPTSNSNQEPFLRWVTRLLTLADGDIPLVNSISYDDDEDAMPHAFTDNLNTQFMKAGSRGVSLLFCSGDDGVGGETVRAHGASACPVFKPAFPACSPYATAVGGTQQLSLAPDYNGLTETVSDTATGSIITSGGGFSNRYPTPSYQTADVAKYLAAADLPPASFFNRAGRAYPDISGMATNYEIVINGSWIFIGGTSASTPLVASMVSLINDKNIGDGNHPLGFLNPLLYSLDVSVFNDISYGTNKCSAVPTNCCPYGFKAISGFDPLTGLGSPKFESLYARV